MTKSQMHSSPKNYGMLDESDRGFVLVLAAQVEESIELALRSIFKRNKVSKTIQDSLFESNGSLATFSGKLKIAFSFGLMPLDDYKDVDFVRKLRNVAAHSEDDFDLSERSLSKQIEQLKCVRPYLTMTKRYSLAQSGEDATDESRAFRDAKLRVAGYLKVSTVALYFGMVDVRKRLFSQATGISIQDIKKLQDAIIASNSNGSNDQKRK
jgi:DNA-binding MltR family transcriptional regulator